MFVCLIALKLEQNQCFCLSCDSPLHAEGITCCGSSGLLSELICLTLPQEKHGETMACGLPIGRAGRSHFHFVLTVRVPGMFLLPNNDKIYG